MFGLVLFPKPYLFEVGVFEDFVNRPFPHLQQVGPLGGGRSALSGGRSIFRPHGCTIRDPLSGAKSRTKGTAKRARRKERCPNPFLRSSRGDGRARTAEKAAKYGEPPKLFYHNRGKGIRLYLGDALELLRNTRSELFDMVFADPPYFLSNDGITCHAGRMVSVNKGRWDKAESFEAAHEFNVNWLRECQRVLKPNGSIWVTGTSHNIYSIGYAMQILGYKILNDIAWYKVNPPPNLSCRYFTHATETILWARKSRKARHYFDYEAMKAIGDPRPGRQMQSLWRIQPPGPDEKKYGKHPTQKPEALLERIILASTRPCDLVLDPFCGSGTTGVACARLNRAFIGFDVDQSFLHVAIRRIEDEVRQPRLDDPRNDVQQIGSRRAVPPVT